jgi:hypothetical protein
MTRGDLTAEEWRRLLSPIREYIRPRVGAVARDREGTGRVLIVENAADRGDDFRIDAIGKTVAEENPEYPEGDTVFSCVYLETIPESVDQYGTAAVARDARRRDIPTYHFPESRLAAISPDRITLADYRRGGEK